LLHLQHDLQQKPLLFRCTARSAPFCIPSEQGNLARFIRETARAPGGGLRPFAASARNLEQIAIHGHPWPESAGSTISQIGTNREHIKAWAKNFLGLSAGFHLACSHAPFTCFA
jgi:hypothetical protein